MMMYAKDQEVFENVLSPETLSVSQFVKGQREEIKALNFWDSTSRKWADRTSWLQTWAVFPEKERTTAKIKLWPERWS